MDELEEFLGVFFQECEERLGELARLPCFDVRWAPETPKPSTQRSARCIRSKAAPALSASTLWSSLRTSFETVMDHIRSDKLEPTSKQCMQVSASRVSDMMAALIEEAQGNGDASQDVKAKIMDELAVLAGMEPTHGGGEAAAADAAAAADEGAADAAVEEEAEVEARDRRRGCGGRTVCGCRRADAWRQGRKRLKTTSIKTRRRRMTLRRRLRRQAYARRFHDHHRAWSGIRSLGP